MHDFTLVQPSNYNFEKVFYQCALMADVMIYAFYVRSVNGVIMTGHADVVNGIPYLSEDLISLKETVERGDERTISVVIDVLGMQKRNLDDMAIHTKIPGSDIWYMTCVENENDVFDGFLSNGEALLMPYHMIDSDAVLSQAYDLSDNCIPVLFVSGDKVLSNNEDNDLTNTLSRMERLNFTRTIVFDIDGSISHEKWSKLHERFSKMMPYVRKDPQSLEDIDFVNIITDRF